MERTGRIHKLLIALLFAVAMFALSAVEADAAAPVAVDSGTTQWNNGLEYIVGSDVTIDSPVEVNGSVRLTFMKGAKLTAEHGIHVPDGAKLRIEGTGALIDKADSGNAGIGAAGKDTGGSVIICKNTASNVTVTAQGGYGAAGIGGSHSKDYYGSVEIGGGRVIAIGGGGAAGIGSGYGCDCYGSITISGGTVSASSSLNNAGNGGTGIGSGATGSLYSSITIRGGEVTAEGGAHSAGIGSGYMANASGATINISGGTVTATGKDDAAGIGGGEEGDWPFYDGGEGARVEITGGTVIANSSNCAIGHGTTDHEMGTLSIDGKMKVQIGNDGTAYGVTSAAANRVKDCQEHKNARIEACDHPDNEYQKDSYLHVQKCSYCYTDFMTEKHTFSEVPGTAVEKTCVVEGKEADQKCDICGYVKTGAGTGYGAHEWNEPEYTWTDDNMYCTASRTCKADPGHQETEKVWSVFKISKAATCEENGEHTYMAPFSNEGFEMQTKIVEDIPAWGHDLKKVDAAEATCTKDGNIEHYKCARCGKFFADSEGTDELSEEEVLIEAPGHNWGDWTTISDATLSESGLKKRTCSVCDETDSMVIPPVNHDHILITVDEEKNCEKPGVKKHQKCEVCGALFDEDGVTQLSEHEVMILPIGHKEGERELGEVTPATCSDLGGYTTIIRCANCRRVLRIEHETLPFDKNAHSWDKGTVTLKPTLTKTGVRTFTCELCGEKKTAVIAKLKVNTLKVTGKTVKIKYAKLKKKAQTVTAKNAMTITKPVGTLTYKKVKGNGKITVNAKTGKITVKKGLKKGTYKVEIKVTAKGNALYGAGSKTPTVTIKVVK